MVKFSSPILSSYLKPIIQKMSVYYAPTVYATQAVVREAPKSATAGPMSIATGVIAFLGLALAFGGHLSHYMDIQDQTAIFRDHSLLPTALRGILKWVKDAGLTMIGAMGAVSMTTVPLSLVISGLVIFVFASGYLLSQYKGTQRSVWLSMTMIVVSAQIYAFAPRISYLARVKAEISGIVPHDNRQAEVILELLAGFHTQHDAGLALPIAYLAALLFLTLWALVSIVRVRLGLSTLLSVIFKLVFFLGFTSCLFSFAAASFSFRFNKTLYPGIRSLIGGFCACAAVTVSLAILAAHSSYKKAHSRQSEVVVALV